MKVLQIVLGAILFLWAQERESYSTIATPFQWVTVSGVVSDVDAFAVKITSRDNYQHIVETGIIRQHEHTWPVKPGDTITATGMYEFGKVEPVVIHHRGETYYRYWEETERFSADSLNLSMEEYQLFQEYQWLEGHRKRKLGVAIFSYAWGSGWITAGMLTLATHTPDEDVWVDITPVFGTAYIIGGAISILRGAIFHASAATSKQKAQAIQKGAGFDLDRLELIGACNGKTFSVKVSYSF